MSHVLDAASAKLPAAGHTHSTLAVHVNAVHTFCAQHALQEAADHRNLSPDKKAVAVVADQAHPVVVGILCFL